MAREVAVAVYDGEHAPQVPNALYYHAKYIKPSWAKPSRRVATIGSHVIYRGVCSSRNSPRRASRSVR